MLEEEKQFPEIPKEEGLTPKELAGLKGERRKENLPRYQEAQTKIHTAQGMEDRLAVLDELSPYLPKDLGKIIINPETGEPYGVASLLGKVNRQTQRYL